MDRSSIPGLFGQKHSSRDYTKAENWGKNIFNSSFPASLVAYMECKGIKPVYLCVNKDNELVHSYISPTELLGVNPLSDDAYYNFEAGYSPFEKFYSGTREKIDLVMMNRRTNKSLIGLEVKLTALPDNTTKKDGEEGFSCELVVRPPTICFLACSICDLFTTDKEKIRLRKMLNTVPKITHWEDVEPVYQNYRKIEDAIKMVVRDAYSKQRPLILQPVWKMKDGKLADDCLDVFVWSNFAVLQMCYSDTLSKKVEITRFQRTVVWIYLMLKDFVDYDIFDYTSIIKNHSYENANDKAFSMPGKSSWRLLHSPELTHPRVNKSEIKNMILGGGQNLLSPERRFDAVIVNTPSLFE